MSFIQYHQGCPGPGKAGGCWGPIGPYYTVFGTEMRFLWPHLAVALILALVSMSILYTLRKKGRLRLATVWIYLIPVGIFIVLFLVLAAIFRMTVVY